MKIDLKLSVKQLSALVHSFNVLAQVSTASTRETKVSRSVLDKVILKFKTKHLTATSNLTLFNTKKKFKFSLEYHEAHFLEMFVAIAEHLPMSDYDKNVIGFIKSTLNQQLS